MSSDPFVPAITSLRQLSTRFVIIGGIAVARYLPGRFTEDLDILISASDTDHIQSELELIGAIRMGHLSIGGYTYRFASGLELDVLESSAPWLPFALDHPPDTPGDWPVISMPFLVLMKLDAGRERDLRDVALIVGRLSDQQFMVIQETVSRFLPDAADDLVSLRELGILELRSRPMPNEGVDESAPEREEPRCE